MYKNIKLILKDPFRPFCSISANFFPAFFRGRYASILKNIGLNQPYFILSFDCDTDKDFDVAETVHHKLQSFGITPSYAVPGELLIKGKNVYKALKNSGAEFLNHGFITHTFYDQINFSYESTLFYDELNNDEVRKDIMLGHETCCDILGESPKGFRTPHFGTYQSNSQLSYLYSILNELDYQYSSSTLPYKGMWHGPIIKDSSGILEFPVTGCFDYPSKVLDSWGFRFSKKRKLNERDYVDQFTKWLDFYQQPGNFGIFNIYADPSQVYDWPDFFDCMAMAASRMTNISFAQLVEKVNDE